MPKFLGLTGNMGSGKGKVGSLLSKYPDVKFVMADELARPIVFGKEHESGVCKALRLEAGTPLTKPLVRNIIFTQHERRKALEEYIEPFLWNKILEEKQSAARGDLVIVESALICEGGWVNRFDAIIVTVCSYQDRVRRLVEYRGMELSDIENRIKTQLPQEELLRHATYQIDTECDLTELVSRVAALYTQLRN